LGLNGNKLCGKEIEIGYMAIAMQEVFELDIVVPYVRVTTYKCHTYTNISKGVMMLWSNKSMKLMSDAPIYNANVV
jgi:hypothetical protein